MECVRYLGDGVYANFDGVNINISVNDHRNPSVVVMEPSVVEALVTFKDDMLNEKSNITYLKV